jgi:hypothetical protein
MNIRRRTVGRRAGAAVLLCGPLVAGCGTATRLAFSEHSRPAPPVDVSVYLGPGGIRVDPQRLTPGPVQFNVINQTGAAAAVAVTIINGRTLGRSPRIPAGGTAQFKAELGAYTVGIGIAGQPTTFRPLQLRGAARNGNRALLQP